MIRSFRMRLSLLLVALIVLVQLPTFLAFYYAIRTSALDQAQAHLRTGARVFTEAMRNRSGQLLNAVQLIGNDSGFKQAVITGDRSVVRRMLGQQGRHVSAQLAVLADADGKIVASANVEGREVSRRRWSALIARARRQGRHLSAVTVLHDRPYQVVIVPIRTHGPVAWVGMGFALDPALARQLAELTQLDVSFVARRGDGGMYVASTLSGSMQDALTHDMRHLTGMNQVPAMMDQGDADYLTQWVTLGARTEPDLGASLQYPLAQALAPFIALKSELQVIVLLSLLVALLGAMLLSRNVTRPITRLTQAARRIGQGERVDEVVVRRVDEFGELAKAFGTMQKGIAQREQRIAHQAYHDPLTELPNRGALQERLERAIARARLRGTRVLVLMLDINGFKEVNDTMGHVIGDQVLVEIGHRLRQPLREVDLLARYGGDEFVIMVEDVDNESEAAYLAEALIAVTDTPLYIEQMELHVEFAAGMTLFPDHGQTPDELLRRAEIVVNDTKRSHGRMGIYRSGRDAQHLHRLLLLQDLRSAIANQELLVHYQPKLALSPRHLRGFEALLRWHHPRHGWVPPDQFISIAEHSGLIRHLTDWLLREVIAQCRRWQDEGLDVGVALNLSAVDLGSSELPELLSRLLREREVQPRRLVLEVTETAVMNDADHALGVLNQLKACGVRLAIDDFGTGYSSLSHLKRMPVDELKIDKSFVTGMAHEEDDAVIVRSTIELAHTMALEVVAEGVEDAATLELLTRYGCDTAQGYFIGRPMPAAHVPDWLEAHAQMIADVAH